MCVELKVKIKSLAAETRIIRAEERKSLGRGRAMDAAYYPDDKKKCYATYEKLRHHRIAVVRREARATHLAYAFIRGKSNPEGAWKANSNTDWITRHSIKQSLYRMIVTYHAEYRRHSYRFKNRNVPVPSTASPVYIKSKQDDAAELKNFYQIIDNWLSS